MNAPAPTDLARQHLIDPAICIRCNTCEETCPVKAVTHDDANYVVRFEICNGCLACISPCPTGAIDNWRNVKQGAPFSIEDQFGWKDLPAITDFDALDAATVGAEPIPEDVERITSIAGAGHGGPVSPPWSAAHPYVNVYSIDAPIIGTVSGNFRLTEEGASSDIHHIILDFGTTPFPVLEGQSLGVIPPGFDTNGRSHHVRLYSIASPRDGERPHYNNVALTVKRVTEDHEGNPVHGIGSNFMCDLKKGDTVKVVGPYGSTFLMPNHKGSSLLMICTGTGAAPMRAMTEHRRRRIDRNEGGELMLFFGARSPSEQPYFGPLMKLPKDFIDINFAFSRAPDEPKKYVQDRIRERADDVARLLVDDSCYFYICGLKGMEAGVIEAFRDICRAHGMDWDGLRSEMLKKARFHIETY